MLTPKKVPLIDYEMLKYSSSIVAIVVVFIISIVQKESSIGTDQCPIFLKFKGPMFVSLHCIWICKLHVLRGSMSL